MSKTISVNPGPTKFFVPPHVRGDSEFGGNGPHITVKANLLFRENELLVNVSMTANEMRGDATLAAGEIQFPLWKTETKILGIRSDANSEASGYPGRHHHEPVVLRPDGRSGLLVDHFWCIGDTNTRLDAGYATGVRVFFNPIILDIE